MTELTMNVGIKEKDGLKDWDDQKLNSCIKKIITNLTVDYPDLNTEEEELIFMLCKRYISAIKQIEESKIENTIYQINQGLLANRAKGQKILDLLPEASFEIIKE
jgi:hypothetical protein